MKKIYTIESLIPISVYNQVMQALHT